ncbi:MAG: hypothetical protein AMJ46_11420 [Latescibacteria bacterium DG_63]|nr:MAG: hypothetical protein AMJ46_11420 [Latescibacteria bacterium DG_63]
MSRVPVNPFALGAAFVERAVELGWIEVESDGRRSSYYLTDSGNDGLEDFGVKLEKAMQFTILPERNNAGPRKRTGTRQSVPPGPPRRNKRPRPKKRQSMPPRKRGH